MALKNKTQERDKAAVVRLSPEVEQAASEHELPAHPARALARVTGAPTSALRPADVLTLQRAVGNRAVQRILDQQPHALPAQSATPALAIQRQTEEEEPLQGKLKPGERRENRTGLPDGLKAGIEKLSGISLDDAQVHYNSDAPAAAQALAYTQGTDIHVGPGQERHLPHEAWHVVQQKQGRVKPTLQAKGLAINDDEGLEQEADRLGTQAARIASLPQKETGDAGVETHEPIRPLASTKRSPSKSPIQMVKIKKEDLQEHKIKKETLDSIFGKDKDAEVETKNMSTTAYDLLMQTLEESKLTGLKASVEKEPPAMGQPAKPAPAKPSAPTWGKKPISQIFANLQSMPAVDLTPTAASLGAPISGKPKPLTISELRNMLAQKKQLQLLKATLKKNTKTADKRPFRSVEVNLKEAETGRTGTFYVHRHGDGTEAEDWSIKSEDTNTTKDNERLKLQPGDQFVKLWKDDNSFK